SRKSPLNGTDTLNATAELPEIPENIFIEKDLNIETESLPKAEDKKEEQGINALFRFLEKNHEGRGYDDALMNPDSTHLDQNLQELKNELERMIRKQKVFYQGFIREINFHIASRSRSGMIDTVEELTVKKQTAEDHIQQII